VSNGSSNDLEALRHRARGHQARVRLLRLLDEHGPLDVHELGERLGLRPNGVRRHLALLTRAGLVAAAPGDSLPGRPGRPRLRYAPTGDRVGYPLLADMLAGALARGGDPDAVEAEGARWGRRLVGPDGDTLIALLDRLGFAPEATASDDGVRVDIHRCPFIETARAHPGVVCSLHLGLMRGALAELGEPLEAQRLDPLVEPTLCVGHLRRTG
jgi:predicted ArsR family transcriptional regulator